MHHCHNSLQYRVKAAQMTTKRNILTPRFKSCSDEKIIARLPHCRHKMCVSELSMVFCGDVPANMSPKHISWIRGVAEIDLALILGLVSSDVNDR